ncbi:MAG TPA: hypothetical protein DSN98_03635 [Thermoplasmata archaeon]|nr:MAG TPA: hypothetical protein DSN98_03635 [Thermoplasmata archaeon]
MPYYTFNLNYFLPIIHLFFNHIDIKQTSSLALMNDLTKKDPPRAPERQLVYPFTEILYLTEEIDDETILEQLE